MKWADSPVQKAFDSFVKGYFGGVMRKTHCSKLALSLMDSWLARR
jgi:hypothetical protein